MSGAKGKYHSLSRLFLHVRLTKYVELAVLLSVPAQHEPCEVVTWSCFSATAGKTSPGQSQRITESER